MRVSQASIFYLERRGLVETRRAPTPKVDLARNHIHTVDFAMAELPPGFRTAENGNPVPDRGITQPW